MSEFLSIVFFCILLGTSVACLIFGGIWFSLTFGSEWFPTSCLVTGRQVVETYCTDDHNKRYVCYYAKWWVQGLNNLGQTVSGYISGATYSYFSLANDDLQERKLDTSYSCYTQVGNNTLTEPFAWPGSFLLNTQAGIIGGSTLLAIGGVLGIISFILVIIYFYRRNTRSYTYTHINEGGM